MGKFQESSGRGGGRFLTAKIACFSIQWGLIKPANEKNPKQTSLSKDGCETGGEEETILWGQRGLRRDTVPTNTVSGLVLVLEEQKEQEPTESM